MRTLIGPDWHIHMINIDQQWSGMVWGVHSQKKTLDDTSMLDLDDNDN